MEISKSSIFLYRVVKEQKSQRGERTRMGVRERASKIQELGTTMTFNMANSHIKANKINQIAKRSQVE